MNRFIKLFIKDHQNTDDVQVRASYGKFASITGIILNILLFLGKGFAGIISGSLSIIADAMNNLSDASSSIISLFGFTLSGKPADKEHPFGHGRYEYISALLVSVLVMIIGIELFKTSIEKIISPDDIKFEAISVVIMILSMAVKLIMMLFYRSIGKKISSDALFAVANDSRNDIISTGAVLASLIISNIWGVKLDGIMAMAVAVFIIVSGYKLVKETIDPLLGIAPDKELVDMIEKEILSYEGVLGTHDLIIHDYGPGRCFAGVHIEMAAEEDVLKSHDIIDNIEYDFMNKHNMQLIVHYDPIITGDSAVNDLRHIISERIKSINENLTIHDLRIVPGITHTNVIFDCVVPRDVGISDNEIKDRISIIVKECDPKYMCVIKIDHSFTGEF